MTQTAILNPDSPTDAAYADIWLSSDDDIGIGIGDTVSVFPPGAWQPRNATVLAVRDDGQLFVQMQFGAKRWVFEQDVTLLLDAEAAKLEARAS